MQRHGITGPEVAATVFLVEGARVSSRATAALRLAGTLRFPWRLAALLEPIARLFNPAYDLISRHRYRWFGRHDACRVPAPAERSRYL